MQKKAYIHIEAGVAGPGAPDHTAIVRDERGVRTVRDALLSLASAYRARHGVVLEPTALSAQAGWPHGKPLSLDARLADMEAGVDVWAVVKEAHAASPAYPNPAAVTSAILARAEAATPASGRLASAAAVYDALASAAPGDASVLAGRARLLGRAGAWSEALPAAKAACAAAPADPAARAFLGDCLLEAGEVDGALRAYEAAVKGASDGKYPSVAAAAQAGRADALVARRARVAERLDEADPATTAALLAAHDMAKTGVETALAADPTSPRALVAYARLARSVSGAGDLAIPGVGGPGAAARALLRALASHPDAQPAQAALAELVAQDSGGEDALWEELAALGVHSPPSSATAADAAALAFIAACLKRHGAARQAQTFLDAAAAVAPLSPLHALHAAQTSELWGDPAPAVAALGAWCGRWVAAAAGGGAAAASAHPALVAAVKAVGEACRGLPPRPLVRGDAASALGWWLRSEGEVEVEEDEACQPSPPSSSPIPLAGTDLDAAAAACTAVRILFAGGALKRAAAASAALAPILAAADPPLHAGRARNEGAYAALVAALLAGGPPPTGPPPLAGATLALPPPPLFLLGDSHTLPLAWRRLGGGGRVAAPLLVPGLKAHHLRPGCMFYTRAGWEAAVAGLPTGATLITVAGEIDSRDEGVVGAVEAGKHASLEEAIVAVAASYGSALSALLADKRGFRIAVHPVPPVLEAAREVVAALNAALRQEVARLRAAAAPSTPGRLGWLGLEGSLLTPDGALRAGLTLDGTHLGSLYVRDVEAALAAVEWRR